MLATLILGVCFHRLGIFQRREEPIVRLIVDNMNQTSCHREKCIIKLRFLNLSKSPVSFWGDSCQAQTTDNHKMKRPIRIPQKTGYSSLDGARLGISGITPGRTHVTDLKITDDWILDGPGLYEFTAICPIDFIETASGDIRHSKSAAISAPFTINVVD
jgi:hypothetical protein